MIFAWVMAAAVSLALLHLVGAKLRFIEYVPRSAWLSAAGGASVAYVFVHLLPELAKGAEVLAALLGPGLFSTQAIWLVALAGVLLFYGLETASRRSRKQVRGQQATTPLVFWFSMGSYALYNALIAYLLHRRAEESLASLVTFAAAMALHFLVNDFSLREHHKRRYEAVGRWVLVASIGLGSLIGAMTVVSEAGVFVVVAMITGGVVLNVFKEELPPESESRFGPFFFGALAYGALLLIV